MNVRKEYYFIVFVIKFCYYVLSLTEPVTLATFIAIMFGTTISALLWGTVINGMMMIWKRKP